MSDQNQTITCPECQNENPAAAEFCASCGHSFIQQPVAEAPIVEPPVAEVVEEPVVAAAPVPTAPPAVAAAPAPAPAAPQVAIATLKYGGKEFPLYDNTQFVIAKRVSDKCPQPDLVIDAEGVSETPVIVQVINGKITIIDQGTTNGFRFIKRYPSKSQVEATMGDMFMLGLQSVSIE